MLGLHYPQSFSKLLPYPIKEALYKMRKFVFPAILSCLVLITAACVPNGEKSINVASIDNINITETELNKRLEALPKANQPVSKEIKERVLDQLVLEKLLLNEAKSKGIEKNEAYKKQVTEFKKQLKEQVEAMKNQLSLAKDQSLINMLLEENVYKSISVPDTELKQVYNANKNQFEPFQQRRASHIVVKTKKEILAIQKKLNDGKNFSVLARKHSTDQTANNGGDLGWLQKGANLPKEFEDALYKIRRRGQISKVVQTNFGFHIIKLDDYRTVPERSFDAVKDALKKQVLAQKRSTALNSYIENLKKDRKIEKNTSAIQ